MDKEKAIELEGKVVEVQHSKFKVELENGHVINATLAGKLRKNSIKVFLGDAVTVEVSPYDLTNGRIIFRYREKKI